MKAIEKLLMGFCICAVLLMGFDPGISYAAAAPSLSAATESSNAVKGEPVYVSIQLENNPELTTLGLALNYDSSILTYKSSTWNGAFSGSDMTMASDTGGTVNISAVCDDAYTSDGTVVTVCFSAIKESETVPVTLELRDLTDREMSEVTNCRVASNLKVPKVQSKKEDVPAEIVSAAEEAERKAGDGQAAVSAESASVTETVLQSQPSASKTQNVVSTAGQAKSASSSKPDENYKTGAGLGNDIFLIAAVVFGILVLVMLVRKEGVSWKK